MCHAIPTACYMCSCHLLLSHVLLPLCMLSCVQLSFATAAYALFAFGIAVEDAVAVAWACIAAFGWFRCYMCVLL